MVMSSFCHAVKHCFVFIHFKGGEEREEEEEAEGGELIFMQAHALVAPLGPSIMGGFCVPAS